MEWQPIIYAGKAKFCPKFEGGALTAYGITPARYTTKDPLQQHIIENSDYFKEGRIELLCSVEDEAEEAETTEEVKEEAPAAEIQQMTFASIGDAREYLVDTYGINASSVRSKISVMEEGRRHGIEIVIE